MSNCTELSQSPVKRYLRTRNQIPFLTRQRETHIADIIFRWQFLKKIGASLSKLVEKNRVIELGFNVPPTTRSYEDETSV